METVWRAVWRFYGQIDMEIVWQFDLLFFLHKNPKPSPDQFYNKISIKCLTLHTVSIQIEPQSFEEKLIQAIAVWFGEK